MSRYRVSFFKNLLSIDGHNHRCLQQSIVIRRAKSAERAIEAAKRLFEWPVRYAPNASRSPLNRFHRLSIGCLEKSSAHYLPDRLIFKLGPNLLSCPSDPRERPHRKVRDLTSGI